MAGYAVPPRDVTIGKNIISVLVPGKGDSPVWDQTDESKLIGNIVGTTARRAITAGAR
jgi:hypothetical protein